MINIVVFEDNTQTYESIHRLLPLIFDGQEVNIQIFPSWWDYEDKNEIPRDQVDYVFLDESLESRQQRGERLYFDGYKIFWSLKADSDFRATFIGISSDYQDYVDAHIGKFPEVSILRYYLSEDGKPDLDELILSIRNKILPKAFQAEEESIDLK